MIGYCGCNVVSNVLLASFCVVEQAMTHVSMQRLSIRRCSNRNFCFTDLLLRECRNTDVHHLSAANWGIIEVKGAWQLSLPDNMSLGEALDHPDYSREVLPALQQVCLMVSTNLQSGMCIVMQ